MKKLLLAAVVLALVVGSWAQVQVTSAASGETLSVKINVHMVGVAWTLNMYSANGVDGALASSLGDLLTDGSLTWSATGDTIGTSNEEVRPCRVLHQVFWMENTGGITIDIDISHTDVEPTHAWSQYTTSIGTDCSGQSEDEYRLEYLLYDSDADSTTPDGSYAWSTNLQHVPGSEGAIVSAATDDGGTDLDLLAEDPSAITDGSWADQDDQREFHVVFITPPSASATENHSYKVNLRGTINGD